MPGLASESIPTKIYYVDDTVVYRIIHSTDYIQKLQEDLNIIHQWTKEWFVLFNTLK